jgi:HD superfamily phosphohydrolase
MSLSTQVRDYVHGFIKWSKPIVRIVDTAAFQRLRGIRQLAFAHYVYPGATHTRFDHSIGVYHLAGRLADQLKLHVHHREVVQYAALLHDIGHPPFSHVSEPVLDEFCDPKVRAPSEDKTHEKVTLDVIRFSRSLSRVMPPSLREEVIRLLSDVNRDTIPKQIVSGPLDADKMDYLLRDSMKCGVRYGVYDPDQLVRSLRRHRDVRTQKVTMMVRRDGMRCVEQFILAKYHITTQVYRHKVRLVTDGMVVKALREGIRTDGIDSLRKLFSYDGSPEFIEQLLRWDDEAVLREFTGDKYRGTTVHYLLSRIRQRHLFKQIYTRQILPGNFGARITMRLLKLEPTDPRIVEIERRVADRFDIRPRDVIVTVVGIKNVKKAASSEGGILVEPEGDRLPPTFADASPLFRDLHTRYQEKYLDCYMKTGYRSESAKRRKQAEFARFFKDTIADVIGKGSARR